MAPQNRAAWLNEKGGRLEVRETTYNPPSDGEIVIRSHTIAINPVDWKMRDYGAFVKEYPWILGCDVAGVVEEFGKGVTQFEKGDRVIGHALMLSHGIQYASFQTYVRCPAIVACKLPESSSFEEGSVLPLAVSTAALGLFSHDQLDLPRPSLSPKASDDVVFIYSGSSSVGTTAIQLAKAAGLVVATTASAQNHKFCKEMGADYVFDYKDAGWVDQAAEALKGKRVVGAFDAIAEESTGKSIMKLLEQTGSKGSIALVLPPPEGVHGKMVWGADMAQDDELARTIWADFLPQALEKGTFVPKPDPIVAGQGLEEIEKGMDMQRNGVSARKVVVNLR